MLLKFRMENYRSFGSECALDMVAGMVRSHPDHTMTLDGTKVLASAFVFGANASGKTNLVRGIFDSQQMIVKGIPIGRDRYCRTSEGAEDRPTGFEFTFGIDGLVYSYGFEILLREGRVTGEWLLLQGPRSRSSVFTREGDEVSTDLDLSPDERGLFDVYRRESVRNGSLLLRALSRADLPPDGQLSHVRRVMDWFGNRLVVIFPDSKRIRETGDDVDLLRRLLDSYGTGVTDVGFEEAEGQPFRIEGRLDAGTVVNVRSGTDILRITGSDDANKVERMVFHHGDARFGFADESDGTQRLFDLAPILDDGSGEDMTYVVDELDRSMHPQLTRRYVSDFLRIAGRSRRQLIATVHESRLMDLNLLRRDELWIVNMTGDGSRLYSIDDFLERGDRRVDRAYLDGRYDGIPCFKELFPDLEDDDETDRGVRLQNGEGASQGQEEGVHRKRGVQVRGPVLRRDPQRQEPAGHRPQHRDRGAQPLHGRERAERPPEGRGDSPRLSDLDP